jgi:hypothetical protein
MNSTDPQTSLNAILMQIPTGVLGIIILLVSIWLTNKYKLRFPVIAYVISSGRSLAQADQVVESAYSLLLEQQLSPTLTERIPEVYSPHTTSPTSLPVSNPSFSRGPT